MAADITDITRNARFQARRLYPDSLPEQLAWVGQQYDAIGSDAEATALSQDGTSSAFQYRGANPDERRSALRAAYEELETLIAADADGTVPLPPPAVLRPRFYL